jgi:hydroxymethylglutaryl-CoA reductase
VGVGIVSWGKIAGVTSADELQRIIAATGLAQNFGALKALATVGIQKGTDHN